MPTALDRLLASPSALRRLRSIVYAPDLPTICCLSYNRCDAKAARREHAISHQPVARKLDVLRLKKTAKDVDSTEALANIEEASPPQSSLPPVEKRWTGDRDSNNLKRLVQVLQYQERLHGLRGIRDYWVSHTEKRLRLPTSDGPEAAIIWSTLIKHPQNVIPIIYHASFTYKKNGKVYPRLYETCMSYWLPRAPDAALRYHHLLVLNLHLKSIPLREVVEAALESTDPKALEALMEIYQTSNERNMYDVMVPALCDRGEFAMARKWHIICRYKKDLPSDSTASHPVVQLLSAESSLESFGRNTEGRFVFHSTKGGKHTQKPYYDESLLRRLARREIESVKFDDPFCAKLFATRTFLPASIIKGLTMVGVNEIGPLALRTLGLRTEPLAELPTRFEELKAAGIVVQGCVFSLALEKFTLQKNFALVRSILDTDQHPDVFEDAQLQKQLLNFYLEQKDWVQAHRTLAILTLFHNDSKAKSWNILLQARARQLDAEETSQVLSFMRTHGINVGLESMIAIKGMLRRRRPGHLPVVASGHKFDDLRFVTTSFLTILEFGLGFIPPLAWREILRRYGMYGRVRELKRLIFRLLHWYTLRGHYKFDSLPEPSNLDLASRRLRMRYPHSTQYFNLPPFLSQRHARWHPLRQLFPASFQQALIIWGFRAALLPNAPTEQSLLNIRTKKHYRKDLQRRGILKREDWSVGLRAVVELRNAGVHVHRHTVARALQMQFIVLFGRRGRPSERLANRIMRHINTKTYEHYVREVNTIWGGPLFAEPLRLKRVLSDDPWHPNLPQRQRRSSITLWEVIARLKREADSRDGATKGGTP